MQSDRPNWYVCELCGCEFNMVKHSFEDRELCPHCKEKTMSIFNTFSSLLNYEQRRLVSDYIINNTSYWCKNGDNVDSINTIDFVNGFTDVWNTLSEDARKLILTIIKECF